MEKHIKYISSFEALLQTRFENSINAMCFSRNLLGDFSEIIEKLQTNENITDIQLDQLTALELSDQGNLARNLLIEDYMILKSYGALPSINIIKFYERDDSFLFFPTDVYSFHVDRSPIPTDTFLCTYFGASSEIVANSQAIQKITLPEIRVELKKLFDGSEKDFVAFLSENYFDLHYQALQNAEIISLGVGNVWKLATDYPESLVLPCIHRAPVEREGEPRLLMIC